MAIVSIGVDHRSAPLELLERLAVNDDSTAKVLTEIRNSAHVEEVVVLSTCMRTEIYVSAERFHGAVADVRDALALTKCVDVEDVSGHLVTHYDDSAVTHLFRVASGLDSAVLGEGEVLGQVVKAWEVSRQEGCCGPVLEQLFRHAVETGKRVRSHTEIGRGPTSVPQAALAMAAGHLGELKGRRFVLMGTGDMGSGLAFALRKAAKVADVVVCNRTPERAEALAREVNGRAVAFERASSEIVQADVLLTSTAAPVHLLDREDVELLMAQRAHRPLLIIDLAVPRDIEPGVAAIPGVTLLDIEDLKKFAERGVAQRVAEIERAEAIIAAEAERYDGDVTVRSVAPLVSEWRQHAEEIRQRELERYATRLGPLSPAQQVAVEALTSALVAKLLHEPTVRLKEAAASSKGERMVEAFRALHGLNP